MPGMGDYRIVIEGVGTHHGCSDNAADTIARAAAAELKRVGHTVKSATLVALRSVGGEMEVAADYDKVDLLAEVPHKGLVVDYHYTNAGGTRCTRPAVVAVAWNPGCVNVNVDFQDGDSERGHGEFPAMGTSRTSVLGAFDAGPGGVDDPPSWSRRT
jgi:hypothetical protein